MEVSHNYDLQGFTLFLALQSWLIEVSSKLPILQSTIILVCKILSHFLYHNLSQLRLTKVLFGFLFLAAYYKRNQATCLLGQNMASLVRHKNSQIFFHISYYELVLLTCLVNLSY